MSLGTYGEKTLERNPLDLIKSFRGQPFLGPLHGPPFKPQLSTSVASYPVPISGNDAI